MEQPELETDGYSKGNWKPYPYSPSFEAAIVFVALFGLATIYLIYYLGMRLIKEISVSYG